MRAFRRSRHFMILPLPGTTWSWIQSPRAFMPLGNLTRSSTIVPFAARPLSQPSSTLTCTYWMQLAHTQRSHKRCSVERPGRLASAPPSQRGRC
jgi:hypothetical protein